MLTRNVRHDAEKFSQICARWGKRSGGRWCPRADARSAALSNQHFSRPDRLKPNRATIRLGMLLPGTAEKRRAPAAEMRPLPSRPSVCVSARRGGGSSIGLARIPRLFARAVLVHHAVAVVVDVVAADLGRAGMHRRIRVVAIVAPGDAVPVRVGAVGGAPLLAADEALETTYAASRRTSRSGMELISIENLMPGLIHRWRGLRHLASHRRADTPAKSLRGRQLVEDQTTPYILATVAGAWASGKTRYRRSRAGHFFFLSLGRIL